MVDRTKLKNAMMDSRLRYRKELMTHPKLHYFFLELTLNCNEHCLHCGSRCGEVFPDNLLSLQEYKDILVQMKEDFGTEGYTLAVTGGEPLLYPHFFELMTFAKELGFHWGMTSNGTLITKEVAQKLKTAGMGTIAISVDGLEADHDEFRRSPGGYKRAMQGINNLIEVGGFRNIMITTVVTHKTIGKLDEMLETFDKLDIDTWRLINIEPMGRALDHPDLLLTPEDYRVLLEYIKVKSDEGYPIIYSCAHFLGDYEYEVRNWGFTCEAGIGIASITCYGDIIACLDIERTPDVVQGNIRKDRFKDVWENKFEIFRNPEARRTEKCKNCQKWDNCIGGACHTFDYRTNQQRLCFKDILF